MSKDFIYSTVSDEVKKTLDERKNLIGKDKATDASHEWNLRKTAYAEVHLLQNPITEDETDSQYIHYLRDEFKDSDILSTISGKDHKGFKTDYNPENRYMPSYPAIIDIEVTNKARLGSIREATIRLSTHSLEQFVEVRDSFLKFRSWIAIEWGWSLKRSSLDSDQMIGRIYNFSYTLRNDTSGGFDIVLYLIGPGSTALASAYKSFKDVVFLESTNRELSLKPLPDPFSVALEQVKSLTPVILINYYRDNSYENGINYQLDLENYSEIIEAVTVLFYSKDITTYTKRSNSTQQSKNRFLQQFIITSMKYKGSGTFPTYIPVLVKGTTEVNEIFAQAPRYDRALVRVDYNLSKYYRSFITLSKLVAVINEFFAKGKKLIDPNIGTSGYVKELFSSDPDNIIFPDNENGKYSLSEEEVSRVLENIVLDRNEVGFNSEFDGSIFSSVDYQIKDPNNEDRPVTLSKEEYEALVTGFLVNSRDLSLGNTFRVTGEGEFVNLGEILISLEFINLVFNKTVSRQAYYNKDTIRDLMEKIFNKIYEVSGGAYSLSFKETQDGAYRLFTIYDTNLVKNSNESISYDPYEITTHVKNSLARSINLSSDLSSRIAASLYAESLGSSKVTDNNKADKQYIANDYNSLKNLFVKGIKPSNVSLKISKTALSDDYLNRIRVACFILITNKYIEDRTDELDIIINALQEDTPTLNEATLNSAIRAIYQRALQLSVGKAIQQDYSITSFPKPSLIPLSLKVTIDGIKGGGFDSQGIKYGNLITTNWLPEEYKLYADFVVTNIDHKISPNDWTTTLGTVVNFRPERYIKDIADKEITEVSSDRESQDEEASRRLKQVELTLKLFRVN